MDGGNSMQRDQIISFLKACKMLANGCLYFVVWVNDKEYATPSIESVPVVREFLEVYDLPGFISNEKLTLALTYYRIRTSFQFLHIGWLRPN